MCVFSTIALRLYALWCNFAFWLFKRNQLHKLKWKRNTGNKIVSWTHMCFRGTMCRKMHMAITCNEHIKNKFLMHDSHFFIRPSYCCCCCVRLFSREKVNSLSSWFFFDRFGITSSFSYLSRRHFSSETFEKREKDFSIHFIYVDQMLFHYWLTSDCKNLGHPDIKLSIRDKSSYQVNYTQVEGQRPYQTHVEIKKAMVNSRANKLQCKYKWIFFSFSTHSKIQFLIGRICIGLPMLRTNCCQQTQAAGIQENRNGEGQIQ